MAVIDSVSEAGLESALRENPDRAIEMLATEHREFIVRYIKRATWGLLKPDELMVAYQETMLALVKKVREAGFDPCRPMRMVYTIAWNKGVDLLRARRQCMSTNADGLIEALAASVKDTETGDHWRRLTPAERKEFREVLVATVQSLPKRQRIVAVCYLDCFEDVLREDSYRPLAQAVSRFTGDAETVANVKSAWHVARRKIAAELACRGYDLGTAG
jgi:DNA-directed RNA polymerase specialized sigma24 family protein